MIYFKIILNVLQKNFLKFSSFLALSIVAIVGLEKKSTYKKIICF